MLVDGALKVAALKIEAEDEAEEAPPSKTEAFEELLGDGEGELPPKTELL